MPADAVQQIQRSAFSSGDPEVTTEFFRQVYVGNRTSFRSVDPQGGFAAQFAAAATMRADWLRGALTMNITADPLGYVLFGQLQRGRWTLWSGGQEVQLRRGDSVLYPSDAPFQVEAEHFGFNVVSLPRGRIGALAAAHAGITAEDLRFDSMVPVSAAMARHFNSTLALVHRELAQPDSAAANPLVAEQLAQTAAGVVLAAFPNTAMNVTHVPGPGHVAASSVRRAVAYIEAHAGEPVSLADIARAAGIKARALQHGFRQHYGMSPMGYLSRVRLESAHRELQAADPTTGETVSAVAVRWGFAHSGRFAAKYREVYEQAPSRTLHT